MQKGCQFLVVVAVLQDLFCPPGLYNPKIGTLCLNQNKTHEALTFFLTCSSVSGSSPLVLPLVLRPFFAAVAHRCAPFVTFARLCRRLFFARNGPARGVSLPQVFLSGVPTVGSAGDGRCRDGAECRP